MPNLEVILFLLFVFFKQFYITSSGNIGIGDIFLFLCFLQIIFRKVKQANQVHKLHQNGWKSLLNGNGLFYLFIGCTIAINTIYSLIYGSTEFMHYSLFWIYSGMTVFCFCDLCKYDVYRNNFSRYLSYILKLDICIQLGIYLTGSGRLFHEYWGGIRQMGTFNDPNQFAFFLFTSMLLLYLYAYRTGDKSFPLFYGITMLLVGVSKSTGIFLGMMVFTAGIIIYYLYRWGRSGAIHKYAWILIGACGLTMVLGVLWFIWPDQNFSLQSSDFSMISRIQDKIRKLVDGGMRELLYDRGADKIILYPHYLLYGAGEGLYGRFVKAQYMNEIHSSFFSILFCYGIMPTAVLISWIYRKLQKMNAGTVIVLAALFSESMLLVNYRQPFFWMIIIYCGLSYQSNDP